MREIDEICNLDKVWNDLSLYSKFYKNKFSDDSDKITISRDDFMKFVGKVMEEIQENRGYSYGELEEEYNSGYEEGYKNAMDEMESEFSDIISSHMDEMESEFSAIISSMGAGFR